MIQNSKLKIQNSELSRGFTLVELLTVTAVIAAVSTLMGIILTFVLRGTNKTNTIDAVRQNGNYALFQISKMIEYSKSFDGVSTDGLNYSSNCVRTAPPSPTPTPTPVQYSFVKITSFDGDKTIFSCLSTVPPTIASNGASLIDTSSVSLVGNSCFFSCSQQRISDAPIIGISFSLSKKTTSAFVENQATTAFQTSVTMRNLGK